MQNRLTWFKFGTNNKTMKKYILVYLVLLNFTGLFSQSIYLSKIDRQVYSIKENIRQELMNSINEEYSEMTNGRVSPDHFKKISSGAKTEVVYLFDLMENVKEKAYQNSNNDFYLKKMSIALDRIHSIDHDYVNGEKQIVFDLRDSNYMGGTRIPMKRIMNYLDNN